MTKLRLSPSGPVVAEFGVGFRLRMAELVSTMGGDVAVPITTPGVLCDDGFTTAANPIIVTLPNPRDDVKYRALVALDLWNITTNVAGNVVLYIDTSHDGGTTWSLAKAHNGHKVQPQIGADLARDGTAREVTCRMVLIGGDSLGVVTGTSPSLKMRARIVSSAAANISVDSLGTVAGVSGLDGTIRMELEECSAE